uniref:Uncharacterized protein n=1 Tax=Schistocephalus solidus TaxID=70667 RepID=A0A0X3P0Q1_SCHSO
MTQPRGLLYIASLENSGNYPESTIRVDWLSESADYVEKYLLTVGVITDLILLLFLFGSLFHTFSQDLMLFVVDPTDRLLVTSGFEGGKSGTEGASDPSETGGISKGIYAPVDYFIRGLDSFDLPAITAPPDALLHYMCTAKKADAIANGQTMAGIFDPKVEFLARLAELKGCADAGVFSGAYGGLLGGPFGTTYGNVANGAFAALFDGSGGGPFGDAFGGAEDGAEGGGGVDGTGGANAFETLFQMAFSGALGSAGGGAFDGAGGSVFGGVGGGIFGGARGGAFGGAGGGIFSGAGGGVFGGAEGGAEGGAFGGATSFGALLDAAFSAVEGGAVGGTGGGAGGGAGGGPFGSAEGGVFGEAGAFGALFEAAFGPNGGGIFDGAGGGIGGGAGGGAIGGPDKNSVTAVLLGISGLVTAILGDQAHTKALMRTEYGKMVEEYVASGGNKTAADLVTFLDKMKRENINQDVVLKKLVTNDQKQATKAMMNYQAPNRCKGARVMAARRKRKAKKEREKKRMQRPQAAKHAFLKRGGVERVRRAAPTHRRVHKHKNRERVFDYFELPE